MNKKEQIKVGLTLGLLIVAPYLILILIMTILSGLGITWNW